MTQIIPLDHKFCCIALSDVPNININLPCNIHPNLSIHSDNPFELGEHWLEWLGSIELKHFKKSNFLIIASKLSDNPEVLDNEHEFLQQQVYWMLFSIFLQTILPHEKGTVLKGSRTENRIEIRQVAKLDRIYCHDKAVLAELNHEMIENSKMIFRGLKIVYSNDNSFERMRRGLDAWVKAIKEWRGDYRLHQFVRSLEAIVKPDRGKTKKQFIHRLNLLTIGNEENRSILDGMYDLRSLVEHMNDWKLFFDKMPDKEAEIKAELRTYQAERLCGYVYNRILTDPPFLSNFLSDESISNFWNQKDHQIKDEWKQSINLAQISFLLA
jgi:hypothetical protein